MASSSCPFYRSTSPPGRLIVQPRRCAYSFQHIRFHFKSKNAVNQHLFGRIAAFGLEAGRKQVEDISYDTQERFNNLADETEKNDKLSSLTLFSPCKINIFLRITGKREDGFHDLASLFHVISLGDTIKFSSSPLKTEDQLSTNVAGVPVDDKNLLAFSIANLLFALVLFYRERLVIHPRLSKHSIFSERKQGQNVFFWVHLDKKVPTGAGLGGGSSNAATALWAANQFSGCLASEKELQEWSSEIGSDIPFFFSSGAAYCTGRGEIVQDLPHVLPFHPPMVLIKPQEACSTAEVYKRLHFDKTSSIDPLVLLEKVSEAGISQDICINDLEPPAFEVLPSLKKLKQRVLSAGSGQYDAVFMSGSGSTIVGVGSWDLPQFVYDEDDYKDLFLSAASFLTREENQWYTEPPSPASSEDKMARGKDAEHQIRKHSNVGIKPYRILL
ncbi:hypothetical protein HPP92_001661 [Vanilla planifolia]|uniref:GHMP kinase N-terminal domain-containing protein n=1 Tax=Vanilla planifolia TaxID=51239 RepID=A0A835RR29_VANPL|nr:hypothetical protein HPP92_001661 [Vanilla planifolia]